VQGACLQSQIDPARFMAGPFVAEIYHRGLADHPAFKSL
jgi:hypothetical protein